MCRNLLSLRGAVQHNGRALGRSGYQRADKPHIKVLFLGHRGNHAQNTNRRNTEIQTTHHMP